MLFSTLSVVASFVVAANLVEVRSSTQCPLAEDVMVALRRLLPSSLLLDPTGDVATIVESRLENMPWLQVQLRRADGSLKGEKSFRSEGSCFDVTELVATVIATWEPDLQQVNSSRPRPSAITVAIGLGEGVTLYEGTAIAGSLEGVVDWGARPWGGRLAIGGETERRRSLDNGKVVWQHTTIAAGLRLRTSGRPWRFSMDGGPIVGWATLSGQGYSPARHEAVFEYGAGAGLRLERTFRAFALWLEGRASLWSKKHEAGLVGSTTNATLSNIDVMANLGVSFVLFR